jgi:hypothetical protein
MKLLTIICLVAALLAPITSAKVHGNLRNASEALHRAQTSLDVKELRTAQHALESAVEFAKGQPRPVDWGLTRRRDALTAVGEAIKALEAHDRIKAGKFIEQALKSTDEAIGATPRK